MSKVSMTVRQAVELDLWDKVIEYNNWDPYVLAEGRISDEEIIVFDSEFKKDKKDGVALNKELKKAIIDWIFKNEARFDIEEFCRDEFEDYLYDSDGNFLRGGEDVSVFISDAVALITYKERKSENDKQ